MEEQSEKDIKCVCEIGGHFDETIISLVVYAESLNHQNVTEMLGVNPTDAWNPGEPHAIGNKGKTKVSDFGKWILDSSRDRDPINKKISGLLERCTDNLDNWRKLAEKYKIYILIVGHLENWNRGIDFDLQVLKMLVERNIELSLDIYFWEKDEEKILTDSNLK